MSRSTFSPDHAKFEAVVTTTLDDRRVAHLHSRGIDTTQVFPVLDGLLDRLGQPTVLHFLLTNEQGSSRWMYWESQLTSIYTLQTPTLLDK